MKQKVFKPFSQQVAECKCPADVYELHVPNKGTHVMEQYRRQLLEEKLGTFE